VRLVALDFEEDLRVDLEGSGLDPGIPRFRVSLKFMCFSLFCLNATFSV